ncbi:MAG TPA: hypothetical protein DDZ82_01240 [Rhodobacteraceae bacterium]|nr:hypothetical protein [Paracoccaceae bacterium]HBM67432.1 hypothetical protein [Paracoccaceae bacterium]
MKKFIRITCIALCCATAASAQMVPATQNGKTNLENAISNLGPASKLTGSFLFIALLSLIGGSNSSSASGS